MRQLKASLVPRLPFQLSVACSTGKAASDGKLKGKPGNEANERQRRMDIERNLT